MKKQWKFLLYTTAVLCMGVSCKKEVIPDDPLLGSTCNDGSCCGRDKTTYAYVQKIENMPADFDNTGTSGAFVFGNKIGIGYHSALICDLSLSKTQNLKITYDSKLWPNIPLKYRVWGIIYDDISNPRLVPGPIYYILIDKIETIN